MGDRDVHKLTRPAQNQTRTPRAITKARFLPPRLCLAASSLPQGNQWQYELKLDGYRALAVKTAGQVQLVSRNNKDLGTRYPTVAEALRTLPDETTLDGEIVALEESGRPSFHALQNYGSSKAPIYFYAFDLLMFAGRDLRSEPLDLRRELLRTRVLSRLKEPIRYSPSFTSNLDELIHAVRDHKLEGLIAKRRDSRYETGQRSGAWLKMRVNQQQDFVIGGYTPSPKNFDALLFGYYENGKLVYVGRTRNGFTPALRDSLFQRLRGLQTQKCPFANLPEMKNGRWGQGLTAAKMKDCCWLAPLLVGQFEFTEWTPDGHLRHSHFVALREDMDAKDVIATNPGSFVGA
jgi:DNA ligase D-like protein (predicted ligase)